MELILIKISLITVFFITGKTGIYGSGMDFSSQHYMIPDYFRNLFYETGNLFPSYAFNLGMGQNIYNFSYYGLLSPVILLSYCLQFVKMIYYITCSSIILIALSIYLFYKFIAGYTDNKNIRLISGMLFLISAPLIFHTHRHIMFISYIPFVLMGLFGVERYVMYGKKLLLIISTFLVIMTSFFFAIPAIIAFLCYGIFLFLKSNPNIKIKELFIKIVKMGLIFIVPILMSSVLLLPTLSAILNSRFEEKGIEILNMFIPDFSFNNVLYSHYSLGLSSIFIFSLAHFLIKKDKHTRFLTIVFLLITFLPIIGYMLNGLMYINGKVFIPFIPLGVLLIALFLIDLLKKQVSLKPLFIKFLS